MSLDVSVVGLSGVAAADDADLLRYSNASLSLYFDASAAGFPSRGVDIDALYLELGLFADGFESGDTQAWAATSP